MRHTLTLRFNRARCGAVQLTLFAGLLGYTMAGPAAAQLSGRVRVDGSSTVAPITMAAAELFGEEHSGVRVTVGISGTGGGFKKFLDSKPELRTDISDASRPISEVEMKLAKELGIEYIELPIGIDGLAVMVHPSNSFCSHLTVEELKRIWEPGSTINNWKDVRPGFPDLAMKLYGPGNDSGTFDYFTEVIVGKAKASRSDYAASENDNTLVQGIAADAGSLGYFGYSYYEANHDKLKILAIDSGSGKPVTPTLDTIRGGTYVPLSRPMFLYVNKESFQRSEVRAFLTFMLDNAKTIVEHPRVNYVALPPELYELARERLEKGRTGSVMAAAAADADLLQLYRKHR